MRCPHCKAKNADNAIYCQACGEWILLSVNREKNPPPYRDFWYWLGCNKRLVIAICAVAAVFVLLFCTLPYLGTSEPTPSAPAGVGDVQPDLLDNYVLCTDNIESVIRNGKLAFIHNDQLLETDYSSFEVIKTSLDGATAAALTGDNTLLYIRDGKVTAIAADVRDFLLSSSGDGIAYQDTNNILYHLDVEQKHWEMIYEASTGLIDYKISPDGKTVAFLLEDALNPSDHSLWIYRNRAAFLAAIYTQTESRLISVSNDAAYIYLRDDAMYYCLAKEASGNGFVSVNVGEIQYAFDSLFEHTNSDHTQLLFRNSNGTFLSINGQPAICISNERLTPASAQLTQSIYIDGTYTEPIKDFTKAFFYTASDMLSSVILPIVLYYMDEGSCKKLTSGVSSWKIDPKGRYICYLLESGDLYWSDLVHASELIATGVTQFAVTNDYSEIYYFQAHQLYSMRLQADTTPQLVRESFGVVTLLPVGEQAMYLLQGNYVMDLYYASLFLCNQNRPIWENVYTHYYTASGRLYISIDDGFYLCTEDGTLHPIYPFACLAKVACSFRCTPFPFTYPIEFPQCRRRNK